MIVKLLKATKNSDIPEEIWINTDYVCALTKGKDIFTIFLPTINKKITIRNEYFNIFMKAWCQ